MRRVWLISLFAAAASAQAVEVYRSVAPDGTVVYSDRPADASAEPVHVLAARASTPAASRTPATSTTARPAAESDATVTTAALSPEAAREQAAERARNCESARERAELYLNAHRLYRTLPNGEREYLDEAELEAARGRASADVEAWCN